MKFTTPFTFTLLAAISGAHSLVVERDASVKNIIADISGGVSSLGRAAQSLNGSSIQPVLTHVDDLIGLINDGQARVDKADTIEVFGAALLFWAVKDLDENMNHNFDTFRGCVGHVKKAKACDLVHEKLTTVSTKGNRLIDAILNKVSSGWAKSWAKPKTDHIRKMLHDAQHLFVKNNCVNE